jgi:hypothetical protein
MKQIFTFLIVILSSCFFAFGQKSVKAFPVETKIVIDGKMTESDWEKAETAENFTQVKPTPGKEASQVTKVRVLFDDEAIYVGAYCFDYRDSISRVLSLRDDLNANLDVFALILDTYNDDQNGFYFSVTSRGVQSDSKIIGTEFNDQLNLVWTSAVEINENAWVVEMKIPYSAIRFPKADQQNWGVNFIRQISRNREENMWNPTSPDFDNYLAQCGDLTGISNIEPPLRLAFMPYVSSYIDHFPKGANGSGGFSRSINGGLDIKYGVNEAFTLDMTLVPDFGQVVFDNQVLNLSPFEIQFNENRQFFTEGTELFNKSGLFYSRRIGIQAPYSVLKTLLTENEYLENVPSSSQLYNATKFSGRMSGGLGIGVFNGITAQQFATAINPVDQTEREILISPITNYNVVVLDQNLKNNSSVTLTNSNVWRAGSFYDANVSKLNFLLNTDNNDYSISGSSSISNKSGVVEDPTGYNWGLAASKQRGSWVGSLSYFEEDHKYDPNDLGFNSNNNKKITTGTISYRNFKPKWSLLNRLITNLSASYNRLFYPNVYTATYLNGSATLVTRDFDAAGMRLNSSLTESFDYFEARKSGSYFIRPTWLTSGVWISTNYQKRVAVDAGINYIYVGRNDWWEWNYRWSTRLRLTNTIFLIHDWEQSFQYNSEGYAVPFGSPVENADYILFGNRDRMNITNTLNLNYTMTNKMGITFRLRHYRSGISYNFFYELMDNGRLEPRDYSGLDADGESAFNVNYNAFTVDFVYRWIFLPGSELSFVWKNSIFKTDKNIDQAYLSNLQSTLENGQLNSISLKVLYWLDYQSLRKKPSAKL